MIISTWPSGALFTTYSGPMVLPGLFSTMTGCPQRSCSSFPISRPAMLSGPPGGNGTTRRTGFEGNSCAVALAANANTHRRTAAVRLMIPPRSEDYQSSASGGKRRGYNCPKPIFGGDMSQVLAAPQQSKSSIVNPMLLSHGTLMCRDLAKSRRFYEEFLGLEVVRHARPAMMLRLRTGMYVVAVCIGENVPNQHVLTHWGLNVATRGEVDRTHAEAIRVKDKYA